MRRLSSLLALVLVLGLAGPAAARADFSSPGIPVGLKATLNGTTLKVEWRKASYGDLQVATRVTRARGKALRKQRSAAANRGRLRIKVTSSARGTRAPAANRVRFRARRCLHKNTDCGQWSRWLKPATSTSPGSTPTPSFAPKAAPLGPTLAGCPMLPDSHDYNQEITRTPLDTRSDAYLASIGLSDHVHPDFGSADLGAGPGGFGIPYRVVPATEPLVTTVFGDYADESEPGPYPIPLDAPVEGGAASDGDRHVLVLREGECKLYELGNAYPRGDHWEASGGAVWNLPAGIRGEGGIYDGWTSADAAGLPILPLLVRYDEVAAGAIEHAIRFTVQRTQRAYVRPATHWASTITDPNVPPMGLRLRMRADYDLSGFHGQALVVATALKRYGMVVADNGSDWFLSGAPDPRWDDDDLGQLKAIPGSAFEVPLQTGELVRP